MNGAVGVSKALQHAATGVLNIQPDSEADANVMFPLWTICARIRVNPSNPCHQWSIRLRATN